jgi:hypothetical protein
VTAIIALVLAPLTVVEPASAAEPAGSAWMRNVAAAGVCLDGSVSQGVRMKPCDLESLYQRWSQAPGSGQTFEIRSAAYSGYCLDGSVTSGARLLPCNGNDYQRWTMQAQHLKNARYSSYSLDGSVTRGVRMNVTAQSSGYQAWRFVFP